MKKGPTPSRSKAPVTIDILFHIVIYSFSPLLKHESVDNPSLVPRI